MKAWAATVVMLAIAPMLGGCSREKIDWKSAEAADTVEGYDHFIERHPDSTLATQARARVAQLNEERDWKRASANDTADAYRQFLAEHESGKWAEEARIRVENFALDGTATGPAGPLVGERAAPANSPTSTVAATPGAAAAGAASTTDAAPSHPTSAVVGAAPGRSATEGVPAQPKPSEVAKHVAAAKPAASVSPHPNTPPAPSVTPPVAVGAAASAFGIQLGAFHSQEAALNSWKALQAKYDSDLHGLFAKAVPVQQSSSSSAGTLFRLQAPVGEEARARAICASLARKSQPCVVVLPQPH